MSETETRTRAGDIAGSAHQPPVGVRSRQHILHDGSRLDFDVVADWAVLRKDDDEPIAEMFHVAYLLADAPAEERPITFVFNGGPGASSAYLHVGALGPRRIVFDEGGRVPPPPVRLVDNQETWLAFTDLVFVDPVGTGFSRAVKKAGPSTDKNPAETGKGEVAESEFFGLNRDLDSLGELIQRFLSAHHRWTSPVFVAGESYGGFRAGKLSRRLQEGFGVGLNGAILISPALEWSLLMPTDYEVLHFVDTFPTMAAAAHAHGRGRPADAPLDEVLREAEAFAARDLADLLVRGERIDESRRDEIFERMAAFIGVSASALKRATGRLRIEQFARELLRERGQVLGLYDATVTAADPYPDRDTSEAPDPTLFAIERVFNSGINAHLRAALGVQTERPYRLLSLDVNRAWKLDGEQHVLERHVGATDDLRYALSLNPHMRVLVSHGLYDLVTPYFASDRIAGHMKLNDSARERVELQHFPGGHMFYTIDASRAGFRDAGARFVTASVPARR